jgi:hypothetical protein
MEVPYIGITGVMNRAQVAAIGAGALNLLYRTGRQIMMGVLVSSKTLAGETNKYPHLYPPVKTLKDIFTSDPRFLNLVHYSTDNPLWLREELSKIIKLFQSGEKKNGLNGLNGFQLNIAWPAISQLEDVKTAFPALKIVLQIGPQALEQADYSPEKIMAMVGGYLPFVDYFLLDDSAGFGKPLDADNLRPYLRELSDLFSAGLVIAGGLGPDTLHFAEPLIKEFPEVSIDAQSGLQEKGVLSINRSVEYIRRALEMYKQYE